jgi:hypothetical protein
VLVISLKSQVRLHASIALSARIIKSSVTRLFANGLIVKSTTDEKTTSLPNFLGLTSYHVNNDHI